jgi:hypothetical protein
MDTLSTDSEGQFSVCIYSYICAFCLYNMYHISLYFCVYKTLKCNVLKIAVQRELGEHVTNWHQMVTQIHINKWGGPKTGIKKLIKHTVIFKRHKIIDSNICIKIYGCIYIYMYNSAKMGEEEIEISRRSISIFHWI